MRLTLWLLGTEVFAVELGQPADDEPAAMDATTDRGYFTSTPISFTSWPVPEEIPIQPHTPAWDEPLERG